MATLVSTPVDNPLEEWLVSQPAFDSSDNVASLIEMLVEIEKTNEVPGYYYHGKISPKQYQASGIAGYTSVSDEFNLPPGTLIWGVGGYSNLSKGFKLQMFEAGSKQYWYNRTYGKDAVVTGAMAGINAADHYGFPYLFREPYFILPPGNLVVQVTNLAPDTAKIQVVLHCACPLLSKQIVGVPIFTGGD